MGAKHPPYNCHPPPPKWIPDQVRDDGRIRPISFAKTPNSANSDWTGRLKACRAQIVVLYPLLRKGNWIPAQGRGDAGRGSAISCAMGRLKACRAQIVVLYPLLRKGNWIPAQGRDDTGGGSAISCATGRLKVYSAQKRTKPAPPQNGSRIKSGMTAVYGRYLSQRRPILQTRIGRAG